VCNPRQRDPFQNLGGRGTVGSGWREFDGWWGACSFVFDGSLGLMRHHLLSLFLCLFVGTSALAEESRASLFCGPSHNYYCTSEQEIRSMRQEQLNRQQSQSVNNQQNMARYFELEQKRRAVLEQGLGWIHRQFP
jgi:hypothetical protein